MRWSEVIGLSGGALEAASLIGLLWFVILFDRTDGLFVKALSISALLGLTILFLGAIVSVIP